MFILLMFFLFKYIDDLIGKGFEWYTILELMYYASAANVAMALPLSILLSSIMTFGTLGENYELVAIKSAGISLQKAMRPLFVLVLALSVSSFFFSNYMLPKANLKFGSLLWDIRNKKLSFLIKEGVFNSSIPGYSIRVDRKAEGGDSLFNVMIYDHTTNNGIAKTIMAKQGIMAKTDDDKYLIFKLIDGVRYEETASNSGINPRQQLYRMRFKETEQKFDLSSFKMNRTDENAFKTNTQMLNLKGIQHKQDSLAKYIDGFDNATKNNIQSYYKQNSYVKGYTKLKIKPIKVKLSVLNNIPKFNKGLVIQNAIVEVNNIKQTLQSRVDERKNIYGDFLFTIIEYQRKYALAAQCLLMFFIGAPLGAIIRKGGLGLPVVMAVVFFLIYHVISTVAEKSAREGTLITQLGMWMGIILLSPIGAFLTYKATIDSALFDIDYYKQLLLNFFKSKKTKEV